MKRDQFREFANNQSPSQVDYDSAIDGLNDIDLQDYESSGQVYERRWKQKIEYNRRDCWIAVAVYLLVASVAFVAL